MATELPREIYSGKFICATGETGERRTMIVESDCQECEYDRITAKIEDILGSKIVKKTECRLCGETEYPNIPPEVLFS